jgi:hypothetical protein
MRLWQWVEHKLAGHISLGRITVFGANAMHWGVTIKTKRWGYVCFRLPLPCFGHWWPLYFYVTPNGTPWAATFMLGGERHDRVRAPLRRRTFGHNFDAEKHRYELYGINDVYLLPEEYEAASPEDREAFERGRQSNPDTPPNATAAP